MRRPLTPNRIAQAARPVFEPRGVRRCHVRRHVRRGGVQEVCDVEPAAEAGGPGQNKDVERPRRRPPAPSEEESAMAQPSAVGIRDLPGRVA